MKEIVCMVVGFILVLAATQPLPAQSSKCEEGTLEGVQAKCVPPVVLIRVEGEGVVKNKAAVLPSGWPFKIAEGSLKVSGKIPVSGEGVSGEAKVEGMIKVESDFLNPELVKGCGKVSGSVKLKNDDGKTVGTTTVSGEACVEGNAQHIEQDLPVVGKIDKWVAHVEGTAKVFGIFTLKK